MFTQNGLFFDLSRAIHEHEAAKLRNANECSAAGVRSAKLHVVITKTHTSTGYSLVCLSLGQATE